MGAHHEDRCGEELSTSHGPTIVTRPKNQRSDGSADPRGSHCFHMQKPRDDGCPERLLVSRAENVMSGASVTDNFRLNFVIQPVSAH